VKLAIMQPYFFPYIGYFQLIHAVDKFVIYDDVNYIKQGWINRNRILINGKEHMFTLALKEASSFKLINRIQVGNNRGKLFKTISQAYAQAPFFKDTIHLIQRVLSNDEQNLARFVTESIRIVSGYLRIATDFVLSSDVEKNIELKGADKVIHICKVLGATHYINAIGGIDLYSRQSFRNEGICLQFLKSAPISYAQTGGAFIPSLSIIDIMMFNSPPHIREMASQYELI
jgi:hypothetical protein